MSKTILDLPSELIASIVSSLDNDDVFNTRQANRQLERASIAYFGKRFFRKRGYMLTTPSLTNLGQVADHPDLRKYVQHVWFNPDCFTFVHPDCAPDPEESPDPGNPDSLKEGLSSGDRRMYEAYEQTMKDHFGLMAKTAMKLQGVLGKAFGKLLNLKIIGMRRSEEHSPWGWRTLKIAVGQDPRVLGPIPTGPMYMLSGPTRLFVALVNAVAETGVVLRRFYTDAIEIDNVRPDLLPQETLDKACRSIWYLETNVVKGWLNKRNNADYITPSHADWGEGNGLLRLLRASTNLKEIGLQIFPDRKRPGFRGPENWREAYPYLCFDSITSSVQLRGLLRMKLEKIVATPEMLLSFLHPSAGRLTSLKIRDVRLIGDNDASRPWQPIFEHLRDECRQLEYLLLHHLLYQHGGVSFVLDVQDDEPTLVQESDESGAPQDGFVQHFTDYEHITLQVSGKEVVRARLEEVVERHWYQKPLFTYEMDEEVWHTDTSEEEW